MSKAISRAPATRATVRTRVLYEEMSLLEVLAAAGAGVAGEPRGRTRPLISQPARQKTRMMRRRFIVR